MQLGTTLKTTNGGLNWTELLSGSTTTLVDASFLDENNGNLIGFGTILKTTDGGQNWVNQPSSVSLTFVWYILYRFK